MNVSRFSADNGPDHGVATASLPQSLRHAIPLKERVQTQLLRLATSSAYTIKTSGHAQHVVRSRHYLHSDVLVHSQPQLLWMNQTKILGSSRVSWEDCVHGPASPEGEPLLWWSEMPLRQKLFADALADPVLVRFKRTHSTLCPPHAAIWSCRHRSALYSCFVVYQAHRFSSNLPRLGQRMYLSP